MRQLLILAGLMMCLSQAAFSQKNSGVDQLNLNTIPEDILHSQKDKAPAASTLPKPSDRVHELKKNVAFMQLSHYLKKLIKETNLNVMSHCGGNDPKIAGPKSLVQFLEKKELTEALTLNGINSKKDCKASAFSCVFNGGIFSTFSKLIHDPYFVEFLVDTRQWKEADGQAVVAYFLKIEMALKK